MHHRAGSDDHTTTSNDGRHSIRPAGEPSPAGTTPPPGLLCLAASERDRRELHAVLSSRGAADTSGDPVGLEALAAVSASRRAVLAGPDAVAAIVQGRGQPGAADSMIDVTAVGGSRNHAHPSSADQSPALDGVGGGPPRRRRDDGPARVPTGPLADLATEHDREVLANLTPREAEVAVLVGSGSNVEEIAARLGREKTTVISHRRSLLRKIRCRDALGIARFTYRTGLAQP